MTALARAVAALVALVFSVRALAVVAEARVPLWPGWVVPFPAVALATVALAVLALVCRIALALAAGRGALPYIVLAVTWRETGR